MKHETRLRELETILSDQLEEIISKTRTTYPPAKPGERPLAAINLSGGENGYKGVWPEDVLQALNAAPKLFTPKEAGELLAFLTDSATGQARCYDNVDENGGWRKGFSPTMSPALPFAWIRLAARLETMSGTSLNETDRRRWLQFFRRGLTYVNFCWDLVYILPDNHSISYPLRDIVCVTGLELMCSVTACRGFETALTLFAGVAEARELEEWRDRMERIPAALFRLYDEEKGIFSAGSINCRQPDIWGSGYAYGLIDKKRQKAVTDFLYQNRNHLFRDGLTRHICEKEGWQKLLNADFSAAFPPGTYMNGGYWSTGTGFVLPAVYEHYPDFALELLEEAVLSAPKYCFAESVAENRDTTNPYFLMGGAMLVLAVRAILSGKSIYEMI